MRISDWSSDVCSSDLPLVREMLPSIGRYVRNYLDPNSLSAGRQEGDAPSPYFDVITELWFEDQAGYEAFIADLGDPVVSQRLQADEKRFLDRSIVKTYQVQEFESTEEHTTEPKYLMRH